MIHKTYTGFATEKFCTGKAVNVGTFQTECIVTHIALTVAYTAHKKIWLGEKASKTLGFYFIIIT